MLLTFLLAACDNRLPEFAERGSITVSLLVDGDLQELTTEASNVRQLLEEKAVTLNDSDIVDPPLFTPLTDGIQVRIIRVSESIETIEQSIPFQRKTVRNESMQLDDPPVIIQGGRTGLQEVTVRIVYRDGLEFDRQQTQVTVVEPAQDEILMVGVGTAAGNVDFEGILAFISSGNSVLLRGSTILPEQLSTGGNLDHRVFRLSPSGGHLLYTRVNTDTNHFNTLWVISTSRGASPRSLDVDDVLWADWNPQASGLPQIAYTTGKATELLPGWEANNDLWIGELSLDDESDFEPERLIESYPATYGWWGGNYAWSPIGRAIAFSFADEVGIIDTEADEDGQRRVQLDSFTEYNTRADWVWVPSLSWSPDGRFVAYTRHEGADPDAANFDTWVTDVASGINRRFFSSTGIWSHPQWSPLAEDPVDDDRTVSQLAFLKATNPLENLRSSYTLWLMDRDGSNARQIYPPTGENSHFPREQQFMAWSASGTELVFVFNQALYLLDLGSGEARRLIQDDAVISNPTWAPYGNAVLELRDAAKPEPVPTATRQPRRGPDRPFEE